MQFLMRTLKMIGRAARRVVRAAVRHWRCGDVYALGHLARAGGWLGPFSRGTGAGFRGRRSPSRTWIRVDEQPVVRHPAGYSLADGTLAALRSGKALVFTGKALAKAALICAKQGRLEILWYWTARRSTPWIVDDLVLPGDQYATSGTCYASPEIVMAVARQVRKSGRVIVGAGHSHGFLDVFSSLTDLELMSQLAAERVGYASQVQQSLTGVVASQPRADAADDEAPQAESVFEVTFGHSPHVWMTLTVRGAVSEEDVDVKLNLLQRHQASFFTTHNADGEGYFPVHHVTSCLHCGTRLDDYSSEDVEVHIVGPEELTEEEVNDVVAELEEKAPRRGFFRESWGWKQSDMHQGVQLVECDEQEEEAQEDDDGKPAVYFLYRHGDRVGQIPAAVLEEAAYRCPALARALGWDEHEAASASESEPCQRGGELVVVQPAVQPAQEAEPAGEASDLEPDGEATAVAALTDVVILADEDDDVQPIDGAPGDAPRFESLEDFADQLTYEMDFDGESGTSGEAPEADAASADGAIDQDHGRHAPGSASDPMGGSQ